MRISGNGHRELQVASHLDKPIPESRISRTNTPWWPSKTEIKKLAAWPMAVLMPAFLSPTQAQVTNCQDASATSYISITIDDIASAIKNITTGCLGTCMGASIAQFPASLCSVSLCANSTTSYGTGYDASFTENGGNLTFMKCMHGVTDASVQPLASASDKSTNIFVIVTCSVVGGVGTLLIGIGLLSFLLQRRCHMPKAIELPQALELQPEKV